VFHILFAGFNELWKFVVALLKQHVNIGEVLAHTVLKADQPVVEHHKIKNTKNDDGEANNETNFHIFIP
jgi:hypothetical protein